MPVTEPLARGLWGVLATPFTADAARVDEAGAMTGFSFPEALAPINMSDISDTHVAQIRGSL